MDATEKIHLKIIRIQRNHVLKNVWDLTSWLNKSTVEKFKVFFFFFLFTTTSEWNENVTER